MEEKVINILLGIKADIGELKQGQSRLDGRMDRLEADVAEIKTDVSELKLDVAELKDDMSDVKSTVNALAEGLLETSREVKQIKGQGGPSPLATLSPFKVEIERGMGLKRVRGIKMAQLLNGVCDTPLHTQFNSTQQITPLSKLLPFRPLLPKGRIVKT